MVDMRGLYERACPRSTELIERLLTLQVLLVGEQAALEAVLRFLSPRALELVQPAQVPGARVVDVEDRRLLERLRRFVTLPLSVQRHTEAEPRLDDIAIDENELSERLLGLHEV